MKNILLISLAFTSFYTFGQDKGVFKELESKFYNNSIMKGVEAFEETKKAPEQHLTLTVDHSGKKYPKDPSKYKKVWYVQPISQGNTGTCWSFATSSFYESEIKRIANKEVDLSEMYTVYWEYVERARYFVQNRGVMTLGEGSETNAVAKIMNIYGAVPLELYTGLLPGQVYHNHEPMFLEIENYFKSVKERNAWNEDEVVSTVRSILEHYMGKIPTQVKADGKSMTPREYLKYYLKLEPMDYVNFMSLMQHPYYKKAIYDVPDNWWRSDDYNNVPLDDFMSVIKTAVASGYGISIGGDVSEVGFDKEEQVGIIPSFDVSKENINEYSRQMRFSNGATTDDHAMHLVGYQEVNGETWFLIKDSGSGSRNAGKDNPAFGYYFVHESYVKLKMMTITLHKDAAKELLAKMK